MMRLALAAVAITLGLLLAIEAFAQSSKPAMADVKLSGPFTHDNLTVFLIHGPDTIKGDYLTLEEALQQKKVIVHETGSVNELAVENKSDQPVYIQSGEIVKGGKQDRTLADDFVLAPHSPKVPINAFCVEHGRWTQRGSEQAAYFGSSSEAVVGNSLKLAANSANSQGGQQKVWDNVARQQEKLQQRLGENVAAPASPSSLQLTLENEKVKAEVEKYIAKLQPIVDDPGGDDVIGYAVAINGKMSCADTYGSSRLFRKLWPKLLKSAATEAAGEFDPKAKFDEPTAAQIRTAMAAAEAGKRSVKQITERVGVTAYDANDSVLFETRDASTTTASRPDSYLHRNYLRKDE